MYFLKQASRVDCEDFLFLWESQNKGQWLPLRPFPPSHFTASCGQLHRALSEGLQGWNNALISLVFVHCRGGSSSLSFSSSSWLSSLSISSKHSLENCCLSLSASSVASSAVTAYNPTSCTSLLVFNIVLHWLKSYEVMHKFWEKFALHSIQTVHWHFLPSCDDIFNVLQYVQWAPIILNTFAWPVQNSRFGGGNKL